MSKQDSVDEVFGFHTPAELDIVKIEKYFKDLERSVNNAGKVLKHSDNEEAQSVVDGISNELSWVADDIHHLLQFYADAQGLIDSYRSLATERMTRDEIFNHNMILVRNRFEANR